MAPQWYLVVMHLACFIRLTSPGSSFINLTINNEFYFLSTTNADFVTARKLCQTSPWKAELALFDTNYEYHTITEFLTEYFKSSRMSVTDVWVNLNAIDVNHDSWYEHMWKNEPLSDHVWASSDPDTCCKKVSNGPCCARMSWSGGNYTFLRDRICSDTTYRFLCKSPNECKETTNNCSQNCVNRAFGFECTCTVGHVLNSDKAGCSLVNECVSRPCRQDCHDTVGYYTCNCSQGYNLGADNYTCRNTEECVNGTSNCQRICNNTDGTYTCSCRIGRTLNLDNTSCVDEDECLNETYPCSGPCTNTDGSYLCGCHKGFEVAHNKCLDIDECTLGTHNCSHECQNKDGGYICVCPQGYRISSKDMSECEEVNECREGIDYCQHVCQNSNGSYVCTCYNGYNLNTTDMMSCHDINECVEHLDICQHNCNNTEGSFLCSCNSGYSLNEDKLSCVELSAPHECPCACMAFKVTESYNPEQFIRETERIQQRITVNKGMLSASTRKKSSALDTRVSSHVIGGSGIVLLVVFFGLIVCSDFLNFISFVTTRHKTSVQ